MTDLTAFHRRLALSGPHSMSEWLIYLVLLPFGYLYGIVSWVRLCCYRCGLLKRYRAAVPVISVGNLAVGGTGKTPVVDNLTRGLLSAGYRVAIVSRGYGGKRKKPVTIVSRGAGPLVSASECGDEPYLLAMRNPTALVAVGPRRRDVVQLAVDELGAEIVLLDDGYQHHAVMRDLDLLLLDTKAPFGNGKLLPAGLLREFPSALERADAIVYTRCGDKLPSVSTAKKPSYYCRYHFSPVVKTLSGDEKQFSDLLGQRVLAFAGIADPESFFQQLRDRGVSLVETIALTDHAEYSQELQDRLVSAAKEVDFIVTTEKDAVKLQRLTFPVPCYQVVLELEFLEQSTPLSQVLSLLKEDTHDSEQGTA